MLEKLRRRRERLARKASDKMSGLSVKMPVIAVILPAMTDKMTVRSINGKMQSNLST